MSTEWGRTLQPAAACVLVAAYACLCHYCNAGAGSRDLGAALALVPLTSVAFVLAWRAASAPVAVLLISAMIAAAYAAWPVLTHNFSLFNLVQESGVYFLLGATFCRSLLPGTVALCTRLADQVHGPLSAREVSYTRGVTAAWAAFFFTIAALSILLFSVAPLRIWSLYINFCVLPLVGTMFVAEYLVRRRVLPQVRSAGLMATLRVYLAASR